MHGLDNEPHALVLAATGALSLAVAVVASFSCRQIPGVIGPLKKRHKLHTEILQHDRTAFQSSAEYGHQICLSVSKQVIDPLAYYGDFTCLQEVEAQS